MSALDSNPRARVGRDLAQTDGSAYRPYRLHHIKKSRAIARLDEESKQ